MTATNRYSIYPAQFNGSVTFQQIHNVRVTPGSSKDVIIPGGLIDPQAVPNMFAQPMVTFSTHDLATALAGVSITAGLICTSAIFQFQNRVDGGTFGGSGVHTVVSATKGWLYINSISASQDGPAECNLTFYALFDGTNDPLTVDKSSSLTSTPAYNTKFSLGPVYANSAEIVAIQSLSINTGINYQVNRESGDVYARTGSIITRAPTISFTSFYMGHADISNFVFNSAVPGTVAGYFRKMVHGGARVADATTEHCKISAATGAWSMDDGQASDNGDATITGTTQVTGTISESHATAIP